MKFVPAKCPSCSGDLQIPDDRDIVKCMYCGGDIKVREVINLNVKLTVDIPNLLKLGYSQIEMGDFEKAVETFNKVLESNFENYEAWLGLGDIYRDSRCKLKGDAHLCYSKAVMFASENEKSKIINLIPEYFKFEIDSCFEIDSSKVFNVKLETGSSAGSSVYDKVTMQLIEEILDDIGLGNIDYLVLEKEEGVFIQTCLEKGYRWNQYYLLGFNDGVNYWDSKRKNISKTQLLKVFYLYLTDNPKWKSISEWIETEY